MSKPKTTSNKTIPRRKGWVQTTLHVPAGVHRALKIRAIDDETTAQAVWIAAAKQYLGMEA